MNAIGPLVLLGGTFDPPHIGHLLAGECAAWQTGAREVRLLPAGDPYRKASRTVSPATHRLAMTRLAVMGNPTFTVDDREVRRAGPTYTVDTLAELQAEGETNLVLVLGIDALADLPHWKEPARVGDLARLLVALKGEDPARLPALARAAGLAALPEPLDMPAVPVSATLIRERAATGKPIRYLVPPAVADYIAEYGLYEGPRTED